MGAGGRVDGRLRLTHNFKTLANSSNDRPAFAELQSDLEGLPLQNVVFRRRPTFIYYIVTYARFKFLSQTKPLSSVCPSRTALKAFRSAPPSL